MSKSNKTPLCKRGFLAAVKMHPDLPIDKLTKVAQNICTGQAPDLDGLTQESDSFIAYVPPRVSFNPSTGLRPLHPLLSQLEEELKTDIRFYVAIDDKIVGAVDVDNHFHIARPTSVNAAKYKKIPFRNIRSES
jgi:hypothetical protein